MTHDHDHYRAYLIRLRRNVNPPTWRVSLQDVHSGLRLHFKSLAELLDFLNHQTDNSAPSSKCKGNDYVESANEAIT